MASFNPFDVIVLTEDIPDHNLRRGQVGTIVEVLAAGDAFEVDFSDHAGRTLESIGIEPSKMVGLWADRKESADEISRHLRRGWNRDERNI